MFSISSSRIVGLIAVVCAAIVAPQALAMPIIDSQDATPTIIAPPADGIQGYDLSRFNLSDPTHSPWQSPLGQPANNTPGGIVRTSKSSTAAMFVYTPTNPGWGAAATAAKKSAAALAVEDRRPVVCLGQVQYDSVDLGCEWWS